MRDYNARKQEVLSLFENVEGFADIVAPMIDETVYIEQRLDELRALPMIRVHPKDPTRQKATEAQKQYKEFLQQYNNYIKTLLGVLKNNTEEDTSPLREWVKANANNEG